MTRWYSANSSRLIFLLSGEVSFIFNCNFISSLKIFSGNHSSSLGYVCSTHFLNKGIMSWSLIHLSYPKQFSLHCQKFGEKTVSSTYLKEAVTHGTGVFLK